MDELLVEYCFACEYYSSKLSVLAIILVVICRLFFLTVEVNM